MPRPDFRQLIGGVAVTRANFSQVVTRNAVERIDGGAMSAPALQQLVKRLPVVSPIQVEPDPLAEFLLLDGPGEPLVQNVLVAGENGLQPEHHRPAAGAEL